METPLTEGDLRQVAQRESLAADRLSEEAWALLNERRDYHGANWALQFESGVLDTAISVPEPVRVLHRFLCALSLGGELSAAERALFEHCVTELAPAFSHGPALRMGAIRSTPMPSSFRQAVVYYGEQSREPHATIDGHSHDQDLGLDVATWMLFADHRGGYLHFIGQCATGANWDEKLDEPIILQWRDRIQWAAEPVRFFAVPFVIPPSEWRRTCQASQLVLDRPRLVELGARLPLPETRLQELRTYLAGYE
jgi:hypothetical protein